MFQVGELQMQLKNERARAALWISAFSLVKPHFHGNGKHASALQSHFHLQFVQRI